MNLLPLINGALFVSSSFLDTLVCPRMSQYYKIDAKVANKNSNAVIFGQHIHTALSLHYRLQEYNLPKEEILNRVRLILEQEFTSTPVDEEDWRNLNWALETYQQITKKFEFEEFELMRYKEAKKCKKCGGFGETTEDLLTEDGVGLRKDVARQCIWCNATGHTSIMSEIPFVVKLFDYQVESKSAWWKGMIQGLETIPIFYHGFIDLLVSQRGLLKVMDFKSTSQLGQSYWDDKKAIAQPKGYCHAIQELLSIKPHGYIIRAIRTIPPPKYVTEGVPSKKGEFKKISDWWDESLSEQSFDLGEGETEEWKQNAIEQVKGFLHNYQNQFFPQQKTICVGKYGRCQYFDVCGTFPIEDRQTLLQSTMFKTKEPNVSLLK